MRLPAKVLSTLRLGVGATALLLPACDAAEPAPFVEAQTALQSVPLQLSAQALDAARTPAGLGRDVVAAVEEARPAPRPEFRRGPVFAERVSERSDDPVDPTVVVPFSEDPSSLAPIRPREATPAARPRLRRRIARAKPVEPPKWHCGPCGRG